MVGKHLGGSPYTGWHLNTWLQQPYADLLPGSFSQCFVLPTNTIHDDMWHFVCGTYQLTPSNRRVRLYLDGRFMTGNECTPAGQTANAATLRLGMAVDGAAPLVGLLDEVRIYGRVLSGSEILDLYKATGGGDRLFLGDGVYYPFASVSNKVYELQGRVSPFTSEWYAIGSPIFGDGNTLRAFERGRAADWLPSRRLQSADDTDGWSLCFDGADDYALAPHSAVLDLTNAMTLEMWIKPLTSGLNRTLLAKAVSDSVICYKLGLDVSNRPSYTLYIPSGAPAATLVGPSVVPIGSWTHLAATHGGGDATLYVNGSAETSGSVTDAVRSNHLAALLAGSILGSQPFEGNMDDIRIWNTERTGPEIAGDYAAQLSGSEPFLVAYWPIDGADDQTPLDHTTNALNLVRGGSPQPDGSDPAICSPSFPANLAQEEFWFFGTPCLSLYWSADTSATYAVRWHTNLSADSWFDLQTGIVVRSDTGEAFDIPEHRARFYRLFSDP